MHAGMHLLAFRVVGGGEVSITITSQLAAFSIEVGRQEADWG